MNLLWLWLVGRQPKHLLHFLGENFNDYTCSCPQTSTQTGSGSNITCTVFTDRRQLDSKNHNTFLIQGQLYQFAEVSRKWRIRGDNFPRVSRTEQHRLLWARCSHDRPWGWRGRARGLFQHPLQLLRGHWPPGRQHRGKRRGPAGGYWRSGGWHGSEFEFPLFIFIFTTRRSILGSVCLTKIGQRAKRDMWETCERPERDLR